MGWEVVFHWEFDAEFDALPIAVQDALFETLRLLRRMGPMLGRPHADTLSGSRFVNMKELRFLAEDGVWRVAFAFDPKRRGRFGSRRQSWGQPKAILQGPDQQSRWTLCRSLGHFGLKEKRNGKQSTDRTHVGFGPKL
jgi:Phage derived protein Gp49-like (DUF891)